MHDGPKVLGGLRLTALVVVGLLAFFQFADMSHWLAREVWRGHETAVKIAGIALGVAAALAGWLNLSPRVCPSWLTRSRLMWIAAVCGFFAALLLYPFGREFTPR